MVRQSTFLMRWWLAVVLFVCPVTFASSSENPIIFVVPFAAGSATDQLARLLGHCVTRVTGQVVVVENRPGAQGLIGAQYAARGSKDGRTVFITTNTTQAANPHLFKTLPYHPVNDFSPVTLLAQGGLMLVVNPVFSFKTVPDLINFAKVNPGQLSYGAGNSSSRVAAELFQQMTGTSMVYVPYKSNSPAISDLVGGQIDLMFADMSTALPQVQAGKVSALAVSALQRNSVVPHLPTLHEVGLRGYQLGYWFAAYVPAGTASHVIESLHAVLSEANKSRTMKDFYLKQGFQMLSSSPQGLKEFQENETTKWQRIILRAGIEKE
jgi:tripartite-type tricarboxylate transporter receptor subunit TctC